MSIDWITVAAQIANFLVLIWLLKRFLYRPILDGIDAREAEITARMLEAGQAKDQAAAVETAYHDKVRALHLAEAEMSETIRNAAEAQRDTMLAEANERIAREQEGWQAHLDAQAHSYTAEMQRAGAGALFSLTQKALTDLADETLEDRIARHLIGQVKPMVAELQQAAGKVTEAEVTSHSALTQVTQDYLTEQLIAILPALSIQFVTDPMQAHGIVLRVGGVQLAWTVESYVEGLAALISENLGHDNVSKVAANESE